MHVTHGTDAPRAVRPTGESPTLSHDEHKRVVEVVLEAAGRRVKVLAARGRTPRKRLD